MFKTVNCPFCGSPNIESKIDFSKKEFRLKCTGYNECLAMMRITFEEAGVTDNIISFDNAFAAMNRLVSFWNERYHPPKVRIKEASEPEVLYERHD